MLDRFRGVFESFHCHQVRYLVIGGVAAVFHGVPRATFDLDIVIEATVENARRLLDALLDAGFGTAAMVSAEDLAALEVTIFQDRVQIDVHTAPAGLSFEGAWQRRETVDFQGHPFYVLCREDLIESKLAAGRAKDLEDARLLRLAGQERDDEVD